MISIESFLHFRKSQYISSHFRALHHICLKVNYLQPKFVGIKFFDLCKVLFLKQNQINPIYIF